MSQLPGAYQADSHCQFLDCRYGGLTQPSQKVYQATQELMEASQEQLLNHWLLDKSMSWGVSRGRFLITTATRWLNGYDTQPFTGGVSLGTHSGVFPPADIVVEESETKDIWSKLPLIYP